ncbi:AraC family transcriptional activator of pobA [Chryseobacterium sp. H1D6B]|uniref:helix-turn-helix domain-containing protein n=1 Tax=Chryseobacterium sp. H1D6B TaxID=2940588 RepID=UPI0015CE5F65|nr:helix-turn-helix domain-containing protein [Chryseobacterium sp. H1D6B]MDH6250300.1 AraC family transcriptional activator of pobA [Chryseobacterium sp. H1D6B]
MKKPKIIPSHHNQLENFRVRLMPLSVFHEKQSEIHRDDHYMFILQQDGEFILDVDFKRVEMKGASLCFVEPGQIHQYIHQKDNEGWFLFVETGAVPEPYQEILGMYQWMRQSASVDKYDVIFDLPPILKRIEEDPALNHPSIELSLVDSVIGMIVSKLEKSQISGEQNKGQKYTITKQFKKLVKEDFKNNKKVREYAKFLAITPLYLNEAVKEVTGYPASFWIQQKILLEARRLLFYTVMDVKQIAFELGYEDPIYFSRFFKKGTGMTALQFRSGNQELSHHHR